jgi:hypothetical protein
MSKILVHNNWDRLEEIWLGDVWPEHFYDDLEPEVRDAFKQLTRWTREDLNNIQKKLEEFNVIVKRPYVDGDKSLYLDPKNNNKLLRPPICPRDNNAVIGDKLFFADHGLIHCYKSLLDEYPRDQIFKDQFVSGASMVKLGKDIIIDSLSESGPLGIELVYRDFFIKQRTLNLLKDDYRIHFATNGGHTDSCFMPLKEGLLLATEYWTEYDLMFPGWKTITLDSPTYRDHKTDNGAHTGNCNGRWFIPNTPFFPHFNEYVEKYCTDWIGNYTETYFEVNIIMIDEKNLLCIGEHPTLFKELEEHGITCHVVPFRTRTFWDGGVHCVTLDVRRKAVLKDYFPQRGDNGITSVLTKTFNNDADIFLKEYKKFESQTLLRQILGF